MGLFKKKCWSNPYSPPNSGNPDPALFTIQRSAMVSGNLVIEAVYPGCSNCEGRKILVYRGIESATELLRRTNGKLDPHFQNAANSPIARFHPRYWDLAVDFAGRLQ